MLFTDDCVSLGCQFFFRTIHIQWLNSGDSLMGIAHCMWGMWSVTLLHNCDGLTLKGFVVIREW